MIGQMLGPYQVLDKLGEGGMGEVYRARDSRLDRDVAIKVLPESFAADGDRVARFAREAKALAALNHPNIAAIYGIEGQGGFARWSWSWWRARRSRRVSREDLSRWRRR